MANVQDTGLLVVDIQGKLARLVHDSERMLANTVKLIRCCQLLSVPVVVLEQNPEGLGPTVPEITAHTPCSAHFEKHCFDAMRESAVRNYLNRLPQDNWLVVGIEAHICVFQTARGLLDEGLSVEVMADCISSRTRSDADLAIDCLRRLGANISSVEMCVYDMLKSSKHPQFRAILDIVKQ